ncbi:MAG: serine/threonine protein kinase [Deltaproteobacteria bacterium]|nr:serine/threonine protein kinase [Deltaproteobacteria bacterium]
MRAPSSLPERVGRYEVKRLLGQGAMGKVLLASDPVLDREVAIKMLRSDLDIGPDVREALLTRMRHEAKAVARVAHPNIVTLHDLSDDDEHGVCLVFEYVAGRTLKDRIKEGPVPPIEVARIAREIGNALSVAHKAGVLHRDVKPDNIMLAEFGAKIADFGIARVPDSTLTRAGGLLGTPAYSAPECISGGNFSPLSDQFSLAASLYEAVSATRAFPGDDAIEVAARIGTQEPPPIAAKMSIDPRVDQVLGRGLSKDPARRFATCEAFGEALAAALEIGTMQDATRTQVDVIPPKPAPRAISHWASVGIGGVAIGAIASTVVVTLLRQPAATPMEIVSARNLQALDASPPSPVKTAPPRLPARQDAGPSDASAPEAGAADGGDAGSKAARDGGDRDN